MTNELGRLAFFALVGAMLGAASLATLRFNTALYLGRTSAVLPVAVHAGRLVVVAVVLLWVARQGADVLLAAGAGLVVARPLVLRVLGRAP